MFEFLVYSGDRQTDRYIARPSTSAAEGGWTELLREFEVELTEWTRRHDLRGLPVTAIYTGPDTAAQLTSCPVKAGERRAALAARMTLADTVPFLLDENAHVESVVYTDRKAASGETPRLHTIGVGDTEATLVALSETIERAGLVPREFVPAAAASLAAAVGAVSAQSDTDAPRVVLWVGNHSSGVAAIVCGGLSFARLVPVGVETLVEALARPVGSQQSESVALIDRDAGRQLLLRAGIPGPDGWETEGVSLDARAVLPLLQPVLQRLVVELKQSIRFGFSAEDRASAVLEIAGPGAGVPGVSKILSDGLGFPVVLSSETFSADDSTGDIATALVLGATAPTLTPKEIAASNLAKNTGRALWIGGVIGILAIAADAGNSWTRLRSASATLETIDVKAFDDSTSVIATRNAAIAGQLGVSGAESRLASRLESSSPFGAVMVALAELTPEQVSLQSMDFRQSAEGVECVLRGVIVGDAEETETVRLRKYTDTLQACPLVRETRLGETRRAFDGESQSLSFGIMLRLVTLPAPGREFVTVLESEGTP